MKKILYILIIAASASISGCGGSGSTPTQKSTALSFSLVSSAQPRIGSVDISVTLPQGVSVPIKLGTTNEIDLPTLNGSNVLVQGTYSAPSNSAPSKVHIYGVAPSGIPYSRFAVLNCSLASGTAQLASGNFPYTVSGVLIPSSPITDVTSRTRLDVTFGY